MTEQQNVTDEQQEQVNQYAEQASRRIMNISRMIYEYQKVLNNNSLNSSETMVLGMDCIQAGMLLITKSCDEDRLNVQERFQVNTSALEAITNIMNSIYLNEDYLTKMVANVMVEDTKNITTDIEELKKDVNN